MRKQEFPFQTNLPSPARRCSRSRPPLRRPRPLRFERLRVPVWNPYSRDLNLIEEFKFKLQRRDNLLRLAPQLAATPWGGFPPRPLCQKICYSDCTENCPLRPCEHPGGFGIRKSASNSGHSPLRGLGGGLGGGLGDASPARRGSRSRPPLRRPRPLRFERLRFRNPKIGQQLGAQPTPRFR